jgi:thiosulfate reductase cytochrome b subunit
MKPVVHVGALRAMHAINAVAVLGLLFSGIEIYRAAPFFPITFPAWMSLGSDMKGALRWHFTFMWVLALNAAAYAVFRWRARGRLVPMTPLSPRELCRAMGLALRFRLGHRDDAYNAVQRWTYAGVWLLLLALIASGLALWKPVQLSALSALLGGYEFTRRIHFVTMSGVLLFVFVHVVMALLVPRTLASISVGLVSKAQ